MKPTLGYDLHVLADCPKCGTPVQFEPRKPGSSSHFGGYSVTGPAIVGGQHYTVLHSLYRCTVCHRPGVASIWSAPAHPDELFAFWPTTGPRIDIPDGAPEGPVQELREAEACMAAEAWRGAAALLRSALEKVLIANGFDEKDLYKKIESAAQVGVVTVARKNRAQQLVRVLGNDVLHEPWRKVDRGEVEEAHHYVGRIFEDLYDDREAVLSLLKATGRQPLE